MIVSAVRITCLVVSVVAGICLTTCMAQAFQAAEILRYELTWNGNKAGHGDITTTNESGQVKVIAQAVSDGVLKSIVELWSKVQATFTAKTLRPQWYSFVMRSNLGGEEIVGLTFDHSTQMVKVDKQKGSDRESHSEQSRGAYDPITAVFFLRNQKDLSKPTYVDIYDGKDRSRLYAHPAGQENVHLKTGVHAAVCLSLRLVKVGGDNRELGTGKLWISDDQFRVPLVLTSSPVVGHLRCELVHAQL